MKTPYIFPVATIAFCMVASCNKPSVDFSKKIAELEQKNIEADERQQRLEQEIQDQKLAVERDAIERERIKLEDERIELERRQEIAAAEKQEGIRKREEDLANREGKLEQAQSALAEKQDDLNHKSVSLSDRDRDLAGREALPFPQTEPSKPVADYGMFYDSLSSHGSWFETADYGYVWQPIAVRDTNWRPYSRGRWICSDRGWNWVSEEPFGWATYHYGRWALLRGRGWIWVPGSEWAPSWVSWRENDTHLGWAPLPPETLAYRGHSWDKTVETQFGISASWYNFVETRHFGGSLYNHCLPISGNGVFISNTTNITYIHVQDRQVICGGPHYRRLSDRIGRPLPFYRLEIDQRPGGGRDRSGMRPRIKDDRMVVYAPNVNADWNDGLKPGRITGRMEAFTIEREQGLSREITSRFRQSRQDNRARAEETIGKLGSAEEFHTQRREQLQQNRLVVDPGGRTEVSRAVLAESARPPTQIDLARDPAQANGRGGRVETRDLGVGVDNRNSGRQEKNPRVAPSVEIPPAPYSNDPVREESDRRQQQTDRDTRRQASEQLRQGQENQRQQQENQRQERDENQRQQREGQRQEQQARQQQENQRQQQQQENQRQQQQVRQQQQENQRQQQEGQRQEQQVRQQQQESQRQQEQARQQQENQRQQQESQRQQQQARQQQENQRQQQESQRQQQQARQQQENQRQQQESQQQRQQQENQRQQQESRREEQTRQQQDNQRQEQKARQQQEEGQRRQEEGQRQKHQEESRQKQERDPGESRKRDR